MNKHFPNTLGSLAALLIIAASFAASNASAGDAGTRATRAYETHKSSDMTNTKTRLAANCVATSSDRVVGAQRVWTQHGVISVGGRVERVQTTECR